MRVSELKEVGKNRFYLYLDGEYKACVDKGICQRFGLEEGAEIKEEHLLPLLESALIRKARERALYLLDRQNYTKKKLLEKISATNDPQYAAAAVEELERVGLLDDLAYGRLLAEEMICRRAASNKKILEQLRCRGLSSENLGILREELPGEEKRVAHLLQHKYASLLAEGETKKVVASLARQGFSLLVIRQQLRCTESEEI